MQKIVMKIYVKKRMLPIAVVDVESESAFESFIESVNSGEKAIRFGQLAINSDEFRYATIEYK